MIGKTIAHYEITGLLGKGGMGEVYRALDPRTGRHVAIKSLPASVAADPERLARFRREAHTLASLNHRNIGALYGVEEQDGQSFLIMELAEGLDLAERIEQGPLPLHDALDIARQIAEGISEAHDNGVVHRDLKPANVRVAPDGTVKILDFGLARAYEGSSVEGEGDPMLSPTITAAMTQAGAVLGTAAYMSPEQARGRPVDRRADIWALGCILFESLSGRRTFEGETVTDTLAAVVRGEPAWDALPPGTPTSVRRLLRRMLEKDPSRRMRDAGDVRLELDEALAGTSEFDSASPTLGTAASPRRAWPWALAGALATAAVAVALWASLRPTPPEPAAPVRFEVVAATQETQIDWWSLALSPDGRRVAWVVVDGAERAIWLREFDRLSAERLPDTDGAKYPTFSPDGRSLAFYAKGKLRRLDLGSRRAIDLCETNEGSGISWGQDGTLVFNDNWINPLSRVSADGGEVEQATQLDEAYGEIGHWFPQLLPDGDHVLISRWRTTLNDMNLAVASLSTGEIRDIVPRASFGRFVPPDRLLFTRAGAIHLVRFDPSTFEVSGEPAVVVDGVEQQWDNGLSPWAVSEDGTLAYLPGGLWVTRRAVVRVTREGTVEPLDLEPGPYDQVALSPDGQRLAIMEFRNGRANVVIRDLARGVATAVPFDAMNAYPVWSPDSRDIVFDTARKGPWDLYRFAVDGSQEPQPRLEDATDQIPLDWSSDGRHILWNENYSKLCVLDLEDGTRRDVVTGVDSEGAALSPDGRWLAYSADVSGRAEVMVRRFPDGTRDFRVSTDGGSYPLWGRDGREVLFRRGDAVLVVPVTFSGDGLTAERPRVLFRDASLLDPGRHRWSYDRTTDTFVMLQRGDQEIARDRFVVVLSWDRSRDVLAED